MSVLRVAVPSDGSFHPIRAHHVTGSRIGVLFGLDPFCTIAAYTAELRAGADAPPQKSTTPMERGKRLEPVAAAMLADERPDLKVSKVVDYIYDDELRLGSSGDYEAVDGDGNVIPIEIKTVSKQRFEQYWSDGPPVHYTLQIAVAMKLREAPYGLLVVLVFDAFTFEIHTFEVPRHAGAEHRITDTVKNFWRDFDAGIPPKIDYERDGALIALMYPQEVPGKVVDLRHDNRLPDLLAESDRLAEVIKDAKIAKDIADNEIKAKIGDAETALVNGWRVTFKIQHRKAHEVKASSFRVLRAKPQEQAA